MQILDAHLTLTEEYLSGNIPNKQRKLVEAWIEIRKEDLITLWNMIQDGNNGFTIEPLK